MTGFFHDLFTGNFSGVKEDITSGVAKLPSWAQSLVTTLESDAGQLLGAAASTAAKDVLANGLTTASFTKAAADVSTQLISQGTTMGTQIVYAALNAAVAEQVAATPSTTPAA